MKTCPRCGDDFDPDSARNKINRIYGEDVYENYYYSEEEEVCAECALREISADYGTGEELAEIWAPAGTIKSKSPCLDSCLVWITRFLSVSFHR